MKVSFSIRYDTQWGESLRLFIGENKYPMKWNDGGLWTVTVGKVDCLDDYGYEVMRDGLVYRTEWEHHRGPLAAKVEDRWIDCPIEGCPFPRKHSAEIFDRPGFRGAGVAVPIFSLRSGEDFGIGEFRDLRCLVDWAARCGMCIIQLLPINDTTRKGDWDDSYPYSPVSSFALNPMYVRLEELGVKPDKAFRQLQKSLNALPDIDYPAVFEAKRKYSLKAFGEYGRKDAATKAYKTFVKENSFWLKEYAVFCSQRDGIDEEYFRWMQFHLDRQLSEEVRYAHSKGIYLKGDLPIGVSADSAEAYFHPELFNLDCCAGAPPDFFSKDGQNWGFPTYNWDAMEKRDFLWWKVRLRKMSEYFDAFRIDHILGFFRIWEIPLDVTSGMYGHFNPALPYRTEEIKAMGLPFDGLFLKDRKKGFWHPVISPDTSRLEWWQKEKFDALYNDFFFHRHDEFWRVNAEKKLPALLGATGMLACGEDLGMVPDCVGGVMDHEKILSLEMPMMDKFRPWPYLSVCATSSHDMETLRMQKGDPSPAECRSLLWESLSSASMLAIFPLQDWTAVCGKIRRPDYREERINDPANAHHHWKYRFHLPLENLLGDDAQELRVTVEGLLKDSGRYGIH